MNLFVADGDSRIGGCAAPVRRDPSGFLPPLASDGQPRPRLRVYCRVMASAQRVGVTGPIVTGVAAGIFMAVIASAWENWNVLLPTASFGGTIGLCYWLTERLLQEIPREWLRHTPAEKLDDKPARTL